MTPFKRYSFLFLLFLTPFLAFAQTDLLDQVATSVRTANTREMSKYFDSNVEITILNEEGAYSKEQAELVLKDFFAKNPPRSFELIHRGTSQEGSRYGIGNFTTTKGMVYRTYFYVKQKGAASYIQELRFEKQ